MPKSQSPDDPEYVHDQYRRADNLNARIRLHQEFSTNRTGWQPWLFDQIGLQPGERVLELGCGTGSLWLENLERIPAGVIIVLTDASEGMLAQARQNLEGGFGGFRFRAADARSIPFEADQFDVVIANHMLYHVPERGQALREVRRVLRPAGRFYASTAGENNLRELGELVARFDPNLLDWGTKIVEAFSLENGADQIEAVFGDVVCHRYPDSLVVTDAGLLTAYILSGRIDLPPERQAALADYVSHSLAENAGEFFITKDAGVFEASGKTYAA